MQDRNSLELRWLSRAAGVVALLFVGATPLAAQESFADVQRLLRPGDAVSLIDTNGSEVRGRVAGVGASSLRIATRQSEREWPAQAIWQIRRNGDSLRNGTLIGLTIGGAIGVVGGLAWASLLHNEGHGAMSGFLFLAGVGAGGGAAMGAGFDALIRDRRLIYQRTNRMAMVPMVGRGGAGLQLRIRF
jgi:hypothetical protein